MVTQREIQNKIHKDTLPNNNNTSPFNPLKPTKHTKGGETSVESLLGGASSQNNDNQTHKMMDHNSSASSLTWEPFLDAPLETSQTNLLSQADNQKIDNQTHNTDHGSSPTVTHKTNDVFSTGAWESYFTEEEKEQFQSVKKSLFNTLIALDTNKDISRADIEILRSYRRDILNKEIEYRKETDLSQKEFLRKELSKLLGKNGQMLTDMSKDYIKSMNEDNLKSLQNKLNTDKINNAYVTNLKNIIKGGSEGGDPAATAPEDGLPHIKTGTSEAQIASDSFAKWLRNDTSGYSSDKTQHNLEQEQLKQLHTILRDKAGYSVDDENLKKLDSDIKGRITAFNSYNKGELTHDAYIKDLNGRNKMLEDTISRIEDPSQIRQVYDAINSIENATPPIESLKTFLEKDFVDISASTKNGNIKYHVFNVSGIKKHNDTKLSKLQHNRVLEVLHKYQTSFENLAEDVRVDEKMKEQILSLVNTYKSFFDDYHSTNITQQHKSFTDESVHQFNEKIKEIFDKLSALNITKDIKKRINKIHDDTAESDGKFNERKNLRKALDTQHDNMPKPEKYQNDLQQMDDFLKAAGIPEARPENWDQAITDWKAKFEKHKTENVGKEIIDKDLSSSISEIGELLNKYTQSLKNNNPEELYNMHDKLNDTQNNPFLKELKTHIKNSCKNLESEDETNHKMIQEYLGTMHDLLKNFQPDGEENSLPAFKDTIANQFNRYKEKDISKEKWKAREEYFNFVDDCKDNIKKILISHLQKFQKKFPMEDNDVNKLCQLYDHVNNSEANNMDDPDFKKQIDTHMNTIIEKENTRFKEFLSTWDECMEEDKFKDKSNEEHVDSIDKKKDALNKALKNHDETLLDKSKVYQDIHNNAKDLHKAMQALPSELKDIYNRHLDSNSEHETLYERAQNECNSYKEDIQKKKEFVKNVPGNSQDKEKFVKDLNLNIEEREKLWKDFSDNLSIEGNDVKDALDNFTKNKGNLENKWDEIVKKYEKKVRDTLNTEQENIFKQKDEEIEKLRQELKKTLVRIEELQHELKKTLEKLGNLEKFANPTRSGTDVPNTARLSNAKYKGIAKLFKKIWICLRHPFNRKKRQALIAEITEDARANQGAKTNEGTAKPGNDTSSKWKKLKDFFANHKWARRGLKFTAASYLAGLAVGLAGPTHGVSLAIGITVGAMWWYMERQDKKAKKNAERSAVHNNGFDDMLKDSADNKGH